MSKGIFYRVGGLVTLSAAFGLAACSGSSSVDIPTIEIREGTDFVEVEKELKNLGFNVTAHTEQINTESTTNLNTIDRVMILRVNAANGTSSAQVAFSYDTLILDPLATSTVAALYIDTDDNQATGESFAGIGADLLLVQNGENGQPAVARYDYTSTWTADTALPSNLSKESFKSDPSALGNVGVVVPVASNPAGALSGVKAVLVLRNYINGDPNTPALLGAQTEPFEFTLP